MIVPKQLPCSIENGYFSIRDRASRNAERMCESFVVGLPMSFSNEISAQ